MQLSKRVWSVLLLLVAAAGVWIWLETPQSSTRWLLNLSDTRFGPLQVVAELRRYPLGRLRLASSGAAVEALRRLPGASAPAVRLEQGSFVFELRQEGASASGESLASRRGDAMHLTTINDQQLLGEIQTGWFKGAFSAVPLSERSLPLRDYSAVVAEIESVLAQRLFDPALNQHPELRAWIEQMSRVAALSQDDLDLALASAWVRTDAFPFSHFDLKRSEVSVAETEVRFDEMDLPPENVALEFRDTVAVLTVHRFLGKNTETRIAEAIQSVRQQGSSALVVDLRGNPGGAFSITPLIQRLIREPALGGVFVTRAGKLAYPDGPPESVIAALPDWQGNSLRAWWAALRSEALLRVTFRPIEQPFAGEVIVLVDQGTESAAELTAQFLQAQGRARVFGEQTPGRLLSAAQFDVGGGYQLAMPIADYLAQGRIQIEGRGVSPDVVVASSEALKAALADLATRSSADAASAP